jgi:hypothetical protein
MKELIAIQAELKAPKSQYNNFGKYSYRSCEDILEGVKPLLSKHKATLTINDDVRLIGERVYVVSTATLTAGDKSISASGWAREPEQQKGMSDPQVTGSASSYARKYALGGLFCIDDTKDADATNKHEVKETKPKPKAITKADVIRALKAAKDQKALATKWAKTTELGYNTDQEVLTVYEGLKASL